MALIVASPGAQHKAWGDLANVSHEGGTLQVGHFTQCFGGASSRVAV